VARSSRTVSIVPDVSSALSTSGALRGLEADPRKTCQRSRARRPGLRQSFVDGLRRRKRGLLRWGTKRGKGAKIMALPEGSGLPLAVSIASVLPHDVNVAQALAQGAVSPATTQRDHRRPGCDSDPTRRTASQEAHRADRASSLKSQGRPPRTGAPCADISGVGRSSDSSRGSRIIARELRAALSSGLSTGTGYLEG
jgi:hypothetical protein